MTKYNDTKFTEGSGINVNRQCLENVIWRDEGDEQAMISFGSLLNRHTYQTTFV